LDSEPKILITGGSGKLGRELIKVFPNSLHPSHSGMDITDEGAVSLYIRNNRPDIIIHCAAIGNVRKCEENKELAWAVNVKGTENLVEACKAYVPTSYFIYISTALWQGKSGHIQEHL
jgi:dTDP-4-dehydrorhamnose reductase